MSAWTRFSDRLPTPADARGGMVLSRHRSIVTGAIEERMGLWDWIQPTHPQAKELWEANGFIDWCTPSSATPINAGRTKETI